MASIKVPLNLVTAATPDTVLAFAETPGVTHIVYPFGPKGDVDDGVEYIRCLDNR